MDEVKTMVIPWWVFAIFIGLGAISLTAGGFWAAKVNRFIATAVEAPGQIVDFSIYEDDDGQTMYQPVFRFETGDGQEHEITGATASSWRPEVGKQVKVLYDPANPADAGLQGFWSQWMGPVIVFGLGGVFLIIGLVLWLLLGGRRMPVSDSGIDFMSDD